MSFKRWSVASFDNDSLPLCYIPFNGWRIGSPRSSLGIGKIQVYSDSLQLINALKTEAPNAELYGIIADVICLSLDFEFISISWIHRSKKKDANALAKQALFAESVVLNFGF